MTKEEEFLADYRQLGPKDQEYVAALAKRLAQAGEADEAEETGDGAEMPSKQSCIG
jgi:hypothetical protein